MAGVKRKTVKPCPKGMVRIRSGAFKMGSALNDPMHNFGELPLVWKRTGAFCMDYYEYPNWRGAKPKTRVTWNQAKALCENKKKRLCTEVEWERACKGWKSYRYPYGNKFNPNACNTENAAGNDRKVARCGAFRNCRSKYSVYDLSGNVAEWTATKLGSSYVVKGGYSRRPDWAVRCANRVGKGPGRASSYVGFRCCADIQEGSR